MERIGNRMKITYKLKYAVQEAQRNGYVAVTSIEYWLFLFPQEIAFVTSVRYHILRTYFCIFDTRISSQTVTIADTMRTKLVKAIIAYTMQALFRGYHKVLRVVLVLRVLIVALVIINHQTHSISP